MANFLGSVSNGNVANVYVDGVKVLMNQVFSGTGIKRFAPIRGRVVRYETVAVPHNEFGQIANWSEVGEFLAYVTVMNPTQPQLDIARAIRVAWPTEPGVIYQTFISSDMETWTEYRGPFTGSGSEYSFFYVIEGSESVFFRVEAR